MYDVAIWRKNMEPEKHSDTLDEKGLSSEQAEKNDDSSQGSGFDGLFKKFTAEDIKDILSLVGKFLNDRDAKRNETQKQELVIKEVEMQKKMKITMQYQWIRGAILLAAGCAVTYLVINKTFDSASALFFGGLVAYLFGKDPK